MMSALDFSKYVVVKCINDGHPISNLQLQKILYFIQRDFLRRDKEAFIEDFEAWTFGPVVPEVYYFFCGSGSMPISMFRGLSPASVDDQNTVNGIIESKRKLYPWDLVSETHVRGGAWDQIYKNGSGNKHLIPKQLIKEAG